MVFRGWGERGAVGLETRLEKHVNKDARLNRQSINANSLVNQYEHVLERP
jgi:hypothetical protein